MKPILFEYVKEKMKEVVKVGATAENSEVWLRPWSTWGCGEGAFSALFGYYLANYVDPVAGFELMQTVPVADFKKALTCHLSAEVDNSQQQNMARLHSLLSVICNIVEFAQAQLDLKTENDF